MGFLDSFTPDGTVEMKHGEYYNLMKEAAMAELLLNGITAGVPHKYMEALKLGELPKSETPDETEGVLQAAWCDPCLEANAWGRLTAAAKDIFNDCINGPEVREMEDAIIKTIKVAADTRRKELHIQKRREAAQEEKRTPDTWSCAECSHYKPNAKGDAKTSAQACEACEDGSNFQGKDAAGQQEPEREGAE